MKRSFLFFLILLLRLAIQPILASEPVAPAKAGFNKLSPAWVASQMKKLPLRDKVAQLIQIRVYGRFYNQQSSDYRELLHQVKDNHVGGVILFAGNIYESAILLNQLQQASSLPLLVAADFESGPAFRIADTTSFPWMMALGATGSEDLAYQAGLITGRESRALGVHWIYAPVMDINNNPANPVINIRSLGEDPQLVARLGSAFIRGCHAAGVMATAKHFPGHGDTATDSHLDLPVITADQARLEKLEWVPFRAAIQAGVDSIMTAHLAVPKLTGDPQLPATLSPKILNDLLRNQLGFDGMIVTDALEMGAVSNHYWTGLAAVKALQAGADLLVLPPASDVAIDEVVRAVEDGRLSVERINQSVEKVLLAKTRMGLQSQRLVPLSPIGQQVASPDSLAIAQKIADESVTLVQDPRHLLPLNPVHPPQLLSLVLAADGTGPFLPVFNSELRRRFPAVKSMVADTRTTPEEAATLLRTIEGADVIICSTLVRVVNAKGNVELPGSLQQLLDSALALNKPVIWLAFGNPYLLRQLQQSTTALCTFSYAEVSQRAAARALTGEIAISGKLPVSIPGKAKAGDGLTRGSLDLALHTSTPEASGLPSQAFEKTQQMLAALLEKRLIGGATLAVGYKGSLVLEASATPTSNNDQTPEGGSDLVYNLDSLLPVVGITSTAMLLSEEGKLLLDAKVQDYLPEFQGAEKEKVVVRQLLLHTAGLASAFPQHGGLQNDPAAIQAICHMPLEYEPGSRTSPSGLGLMLMVEILQRASGRRLGQLLALELFSPLGMNTTHCSVASSKRTAHSTSLDQPPWPNDIAEENDFVSKSLAMRTTLHGSARDLAVFAQTLLNGGIYRHQRIFQPQTITRFTTVPGSRSTGHSLGWSKPNPENWTGRLFSASAYGQSSAGGSLLWIDPDRELFIILLTSGGTAPAKPEVIEEATSAICQQIVAVVDTARKANSSQ